MPDESTARSLHDLLAEAVARCTRMQQESRIAVHDVRTSRAALEDTIAAIRQARAERAAVNVRKRT
jgi:hypothetical protein